jgi:hypothetical protein
LAAQATTKKVRVFELAKTLGMDTKLVIDYARDLGYDVKNQLSSLDPDQADAVKARIAKGGRPGPAAAAPPPPPPGRPSCKRVSTLRVTAPICRGTSNSMCRPVSGRLLWSRANISRSL